MKTVVRSLLIAIAVLVIGGIAFGGVLRASGWRAFVVHTGSMTPNIASGDLVIDRPAGPVHVGRSSPSPRPRPVRHPPGRRYHPHGIQTRGDANPTNDFGYVTQSQVVGRVYAAVPYAGFVVVFCSHPAGVVGLVLLMCAIGLAWSLFLGQDNSQKDLRSSSAPSASPLT